jgi:hypothetical protein
VRLHHIHYQRRRYVPAPGRRFDGSVHLAETLCGRTVDYFKNRQQLSQEARQVTCGTCLLRLLARYTHKETRS